MIWWIAQTACLSALLAAVVALVCRAGRLSPAVKHALWLLVLVKLMTPPLVSYRLPTAAEATLAWCTTWLADVQLPGNELPGNELLGGDRSSTGPGDSIVGDAPDKNRSAAETVVAGSPEGEGTFRVDRLLSAEVAEAALGPDDTRPSDPEFLPTRVAPSESPADGDAGPARFEPGVRVLWLLAAGWLLGAVPLAVVQSLRVIRLRRLLTTPTPVPAWLDQLVQQAAARLKIRPPQIVVVPALCSPLVCALGRPRLLWPAGLTDQLPHEARQAVLLHELAHLRRRDHWVAWLELAGGVAWWFNPLYWYVRHQLRENAELACDAWVVGLLPAGRRAYAQALIEVTEFVSLAPAAMPAVAMGNVARRTLERRLTMIMRDRSSYRVPLLGTALIGLSLLAVLPGWSGGQDTSGLPVLETQPKDQPLAIPSTSSGSATLLPEGPAQDVLPADPTANALAQPPALGDLAADSAALDGAALDSAALDSAGPEERIRQLEVQLNQLQTAVQALRAGPPSAMETNKPAEVPMLGSNRALRLTTDFQSQKSGFLANNSSQAERRRDHAVETLTRARYKLSEPTASALASFIQEHVKGDVEARVAGDTLTVIASQEDQAKIGAFVELLDDERGPAPGQQQRANGTAAPQDQLPMGGPASGQQNQLQSLPARR
jgi:beta-lactamase regulating signal transducer with metallopeptidase domain